MGRLAWVLAAAAGAALGAVDARAEGEAVPDKTVVLTFDDGVKSHLTYVAPLLKRHGFGASFFIPYRWRDDRENFLSWEEVAQIHAMGFEIGNHSWTHPNFATPKVAARLAGELALVERELARVGVPKPVSFAWSGNGFGPEAVEVLRRCGYTFARRGMQPEVAYGVIAPGPMYDLRLNDRLLIPSAGDAYPDWTLEDFKAVVDRARDGKIAVVQFHGVPDVAHPWVHTPPERFAEYVQYLAEGGFNVIALRDLARYVDFDTPVADPLLETSYARDEKALDLLPYEMRATREDLSYWLENMIVHHRYTPSEAMSVTGLPLADLELPRADAAPETPRVLPYPGGRHPRIGFLEGAIDPLRGTKASVFAPWEDGGYAVVDLPEAIFSNLGLTFLAHTHIPTIWNEACEIIDNVDWQRRDDGGLASEWELPNGIRFGGSVTPRADGADLGLWLENGTDAALTGLRTQVCAMLKGLRGFEALTTANKTFEDGVAVCRSEDGRRAVLIAFERTGRAWGNALCPCMHADPVLPDAAPGARVAVRGRIAFAEAEEADAVARELRREFAAR